MAELIDGLVHVRLKSERCRRRVVLGNGLSLLCMLDRVGLAENVVNNLPIYKGAAAVVEFGLQPVLLGVEDGLDQLRHVDIEHVRCDPHDWSILVVKTLQLKMGVPCGSLSEIPQPCPF